MTVGDNDIVTPPLLGGLNQCRDWGLGEDQSGEIYLNLALFWTVCGSHIYSILLLPWL